MSLYTTNVFIHEHFMGNNEMSKEKWICFKTEIRCLQIRRMQDFAPNTKNQELLGNLNGPRSPAVKALRFASRTPIPSSHSFLPTGMNSIWLACLSWPCNESNTKNSWTDELVVICFPTRGSLSQWGIKFSQKCVTNILQIVLIPPFF